MVEAFFFAAAAAVVAAPLVALAFVAVGPLAPFFAGAAAAGLGAALRFRGGGTW